MHKIKTYIFASSIILISSFLGVVFVELFLRFFISKDSLFTTELQIF